MIHQISIRHHFDGQRTSPLRSFFNFETWVVGLDVFEAKMPVSTFFRHLVVLSQCMLNVIVEEFIKDRPQMSALFGKSAVPQSTTEMRSFLMAAFPK